MPARPPCSALTAGPHTSPHPSQAGSGRASPAAALTAANPALITRRPGSDTGSPLGRYGAVGSPSSQGAASSGGIGAAAEEALAAKMGAISVATRDLSPPGGPAAAAVTLAEHDNMLPPGWAKVTDGQGLVYYVNHVTQEVRSRALFVGGVCVWCAWGCSVLTWFVMNESFSRRLLTPLETRA